MADTTPSKIEMIPREDPAEIYKEKDADGQPAQNAEPEMKKKKCCQSKSRFDKNSGKYAEKLQEYKQNHFKDGMVMDRKRTDVIMAVLFGIFVVAWIAIDIYGLTT